MSGWINGAKNDGGGASSLVGKSVRLMSRGDERRGRGRQTTELDIGMDEGHGSLEQHVGEHILMQGEKLPTYRLFKRKERKRGELSRTSQCNEELWHVALVESDHTNHLIRQKI